MKIISLKFIDNYKQFRKGQIFRFTSENVTTLSFADPKLTILIGRNGSGKTTLMSLIPTLFYYIERYNGKIPANFELKYEIRLNEEDIKVSIKHINNLIRVSVAGVYNNIQLLPNRNPRQYDYSVINTEQPYILYEDFRNYTPNSVVTSTFSMHGEYPISRPRNYLGDQLVSDQSITNIYGKNHYNMGSISRGIFRFVKLFFNGRKEIKDLLNLFDLKFTNNVLIYYYGSENEWNRVNKKWISKKESEIQNNEIYLNDIEFERLGRKITLNNMSSGEKMLLLRAISVLNSIEENSIIIFEEPELHLDQVWNRQLATLFKVLFSDYHSHLLIATHDYAIINSVLKDNIISLENGQKKQIIENTFLASYEELFRIIYGNKFKANKIEIDFLASISDKSIEQLKKDYEMIGNSIYKYLVYKEIIRRS